MRRILLTVLALGALGGCSRGDDGGAVIAAEPSAPSTAPSPSAEPARPAAPVRPASETEAHAAPGSAVALRTSAPTDAPAVRSIPLSITGMT